MSHWRRILLVGVGGQGVLSAGRWIGDASAAAGLEVAVGQVHGLSQRGGSVQASVVIGGARSPEIPDGMADALVALEPMEATRALIKVSRRTTVLVNIDPILPASLQSAGRPYPPLASLLTPLEEQAAAVIPVDAAALAHEAGSVRSVNVVMLGMLAGAGMVPFAAEHLLDTILAAGIPTFREVNSTAFWLGAGVAARATNSQEE
jgi:indolepyruvate ferredoxin oxidoreductase beta subunit